MSLNCLQAKQQIVKLSGHNELVADYANGDYTDAGVLYHMNAGGRFLDTHFEYRRDSAWIYSVLAAGSRLISFTGARYVEEVWLSKTGESRTRLPFIPPAEFRVKYPDLLADTAQGVPAYWTMDAVGLYPPQIAVTQSDLVTAGAVDYNHLTYGDWFLTDTILLDCPADGAYTLWIKAKYYNKELSADADVNFWTMNRPELYVDAAIASIERRLHRNSQGLQDIENPLIRDLRVFAGELFNQDTEILIDDVEGRM